MIAIIRKYLRRILRIIISFIKLSFKRKLLVMVSFILMGIIRFSILFIPFKVLAAIMGEKMGDSPFEIDGDSMKKAMVVEQIVLKTSRHTPWESKCLVQALTAQLILKFIKISSTLYLGVCKDESNNLLAHAWLRCGKRSITGGNEMPQFKEVMRFACNVKSNVKSNVQ